MEDTIVKPANPALAFELNSGDNNITKPNGATMIGLDISFERGLDLITELDSTKRVMFGDRPNLSLAETFQVMSYVAKNSQELIYLVYTTGKIHGRNGHEGS